MPPIESTTDSAIGTIVLDHPEKRNALSTKLIGAILETLATFSRDQVRVIVLRARPAVKVWSAGHDVIELPEGH